ncbi:MAG: viperin family antiviral radical SAM protein [Bacteroidales bacterium]
MITTVNFHLTKACNFKCRYCFARFNDIKEAGLKKQEQFELITLLSKSGKFSKINFAGGEPTLIPHIKDLIIYSKSLGFETSIVTNGSKIDFDWVKSMAPYLDILAISVDSINPHINLLAGSNDSGKTLTPNKIKNISTACRIFGVSLKINTVVSQFNVNEKLTDFINEIKPFRWKILQATKIIGQNDGEFSNIEVSRDCFKSFCEMNKTGLLNELKVIDEDNETIKGSYLMVDCLGRFFDNSNSSHSYSNPILKVGLNVALASITFDSQKFIKRQGNYSTIKQ